MSFLMHHYLPVVLALAAAIPFSAVFARQFEDTVRLVVFDSPNDLAAVEAQDCSVEFVGDAAVDGTGCLRITGTGAEPSVSIRLPDTFGKTVERGCYIQFDARSLQVPPRLEVTLHAEKALPPQEITIGADWSIVEYPSQLLPASVAGHDRYSLTIRITAAGPLPPTVLIDHVRLVVSTMKTDTAVTPAVLEAAYNTIADAPPSPHIPWAKPYAGGRVRALVIAPRITMRDVVELQQRFDIDCMPVMTLDYQRLGIDTEIGGVHGKLMPAGLAANVAERLRALLRDPFDVIVLSFDWDALPADIHDAIGKAVRGGTGLLHVGAFKGSDEDRQRLFAAPTADSAELFGVPVGVLPAFRAICPGRSVPQIVSSFRLGEGRIVVLDYMGEKWRERWYLTGLTPNIPHAGVYRPLHYEYHQSFLGKALYLAANRAPAVRISAIDGVDRLLDARPGKPIPVRISLAGNTGQLTGLRLKVEVVDLDGVTHFAVDLPAGAVDGGVPIELPPPPHGRNFINVRLLDGDAVIDWASAHLDISREAYIPGIDLDRKTYRPADPILATVNLGGAPVPGATLEVRLRDVLGRELGRHSVAEPKGAVPVEFRVDAPKTVLHLLTAELRVGDSLICGKTADVPFRLPPPEFPFIVWCGSGNTYPDNFLLAQLRKAGVDVPYIQTRGGHGEPAVMWPWMRAIAAQDLRIIPYAAAVAYHGMGPIRDPCLTDPGHLAWMTRNLKARAPILDRYGAIAYSLGDENNMSRRYTADICHSGTCQHAFREYLKGVYADLAALNREWTTAYTTWDQVPIMNLADVRKHGNPAPWADHHMFKESLVAETHRRYRAAIREEVPDARVGFEGIGGDTQSFRGRDVWKLTRDMDLAGTYNTPSFMKWFQAFTEPGAMTGVWVGADNVDGPIHVNEARYHYRVWKSLFEGCNSIWYWQSAGMIGGAVTPTLAIDPLFTIINADVQEVKRGAFRLLHGTSRPRPQVALYYSQPSAQADAIMRQVHGKELSWLPTAQSGWIALLDDLSIPFETIAYAEVRDGQLAERPYKLLILPYAQALSDTEADAITAFAKSGGCVLADLRPGVMSEHSRFLADRTFLPEVFGAQVTDLLAVRPVTGVSVFAPGEAAWLGWQGEFSITAKSDALTLTGGVARGVSDTGVPAVIVNRCGKGTGVLLNFAVDAYGGGRGGDWIRRYQRSARGTEKLADLVLAVLDAAGVEPALKLTAADGGRITAGCSVHPYEEGAALYVGVLFDYRLPERFLAERELALELDRKGHLYEARSHRYAGVTDTAALRMRPGDARLLALLPYRIAGMTVTGAATVARGGTAEITITVRKEGEVDFVRHVVRLDVLSPSGTPQPHYSGNLDVFDGAGEWRLSLALNDERGRWTVRATEVISGTAETVTFDVH